MFNSIILEREVIDMNWKMNYTVLFIMLFNACVIAGLAFKDVIEYSMIIAIGIGMVFLVLATISSIRAAKAQYDNR